MSASGRIGERTKAVRETRGLSVAELGERSGCSQELIEAIESGSLAPSIAPLARVARALGVRLGTLTEGAEHQGPALDRTDSRFPVARFSNLQQSHQGAVMEYMGLALQKSDRHFDPFLLTLHPGAERDASSHEGEEFLFVLSGTIKVVYGKEQFHLDTSDSIYFDSIVAHNVSAVGSEPATLLTIVYSPS